MKKLVHGLNPVLILSLSGFAWSCHKLQAPPTSADYRSVKAPVFEIASTKLDESAGAKIEVPLDLADLAGRIQIEEGAPLATQTLAANLNLGQEVSKAGPSININSSSNIDLSQLGRLEISIPIEEATALALSAGNLAVLYQVIDAEGKVLIGVIPPASFRQSNGLVTFKMLGLGNYQAVRVPVAITEEKKVQTEETKVITKVEQASLPPLAVAGISPIIVYKGGKITITGENFRPGIKLAFLGRNLSGVEVKSDQQLTVLVDEAPRRGKGTIYLAQDGVERSLSLAYAGSSSDFPLMTVAPSEVCSGQKYYNANGDLLEGTRSCTSTSPDLSNLKSENILSGVTIAGVSGSLSMPATVPACSATLSENCIASSTFKAVDTATLLPQNIKSGVTIGGVVGAYPSATYKLASDTATNDLPNITTSLAAGSYEFFNGSGSRLTLTVSSPGTLTPSSADQSFTAADTLYKGFTVAGDADLQAANVKSGVTLFGVTGSYSAPATTLADCSSDGETGCKAVSSFPAANISGAASKILVAHSIGGVTGSVTLPSSSSVKAGTSYGAGGTAQTGTLDLPDLANVRSNDTLEGMAGTLSDCSAANQSNCVATLTYKTMDLSLAGTGSVPLSSSNFDSKVQSGSHVEFWDALGQRHTKTLPSLHAGMLRKSISAFGIIGDYPSNAYPLTGADSSMDDLTSANLYNKLKTASYFEYFDSSGNRYSAQGSSDLTASNIISGAQIFNETGTAYRPCYYTSQSSCTSDKLCRWNSGLSQCEIDPFKVKKGVTIASVAGQLKTTCRNLANGSIFNFDGGSISNLSYNTGSFFDSWDTIDDLNGGTNNAFPTSTVSTWADHICNETDWQDLTPGSCTSISQDCTIQDKITGLIWTESKPQASTAPSESGVAWDAAVNNCQTLTFGGSSDWRLPSQKELLQAHINGIRAVAKGWGIGNIFTSSFGSLSHWSATSHSVSTTSAWTVNLANASTTYISKSSTSAASYICVRDPI